MANKYLKRRFTLRETILLIVLLVVLLIGLYFGLVYYPITERRAKVNEDLDTVNMQIEVANGLKADYDRMRAELDKIEASGDKTVMPQYDNNKQQEKLHACFKAIFAGMESSSIDYDTSAPSDGVRTRTVRLSFTVKDKGNEATVYDKTKAVLHDLMNTGYRCSMSWLRLNPDSDLENATSIGVTCSIKFFELDSGN